MATSTSTADESLRSVTPTDEEMPSESPEEYHDTFTEIDDDIKVKTTKSYHLDQPLNC